MAEDRPPSLDPIAARRWALRAPARSPWLHEEVGRRMEDRLQWIRREPAAWADWDPVRGGLQAHLRVAHRYAGARRWVAEPVSAHAESLRRGLAQPWWRRLSAPGLHVGPLPDGGAELLWANMALHMEAQPAQLLARWHRALAGGGFLMFSCLGPDTLRELRAVYARMGWPACAHEFTDMHDWGDMLLAAGFAEPVMDMERVTLTFETPQRLLSELRELGANLSLQRFGALRGRGWHARLLAELARELDTGDGRLALTFEVVYGHAFKVAATTRTEGRSEVTLADMRAMLRAGKSTAASGS